MILRNQSHSAPLHRESLRGDLGDNMAYWTDLEHRHSAGDGMDVTDRTEAARSHRMNSRDVFHESSSNSTVPRPSIMFSRHQQHPHSAPPSASDTVKAAYLRHQVADFAERGRGYDEHMDSRPYEEGYHRHQEAAYENTLGQDDLVPTAKPRVFVVAPLRAPTHDAWTGPSLARDAQPSTSCVEREERPINPVPPPPLPTVKPSGLASQRRASLSRSAPSSAVVDPDTHAPVPVVLIKMSDPDPDPLLPASDAACTRKAKASTSTSLAQNSPASKGSESHQAEDVDISASLKAQQDVVCNPSPQLRKKFPPPFLPHQHFPNSQKYPLKVPRHHLPYQHPQLPPPYKMKSRTQTTSSKTLSLKSPDQSPSTSEAQTSSPPPPPIFIQRKSLSLHRKSLSSLYTPKARASNDSLTRTPSVAPDDSLNGSIGTPQSQQLMFPPSSASLVAVGRMLADSYEQANRMTDLRDDVEDPAATLVGTTGVRVSTWSWRSTGPRNSFESSSRATRKSKGWRPPVVEFFSDLGAKIKNLFVGRRRRRI
ncbi:hypothetical protein BC829DRAFT_405253 [Chytridium lagenaria]|nr:hypothetical protein BC829DRAFT_405253 [Chytridium lagenaria]